MKFSNEAPRLHSRGIFRCFCGIRRSISATQLGGLSSSHSSTGLHPRFSAKADKIFLNTVTFGLIVAVILVFATDIESKSPTQKKGGKKMTFELSSPAFLNHGMIPSVYTCDGNKISPPLKWSDPPQGTKSFALISDDPDAPAGTFTHWVIFNIPAESRGLKEDMPEVAELKDGTKQGITDFGRTGYGAPCPPSGTHRYFFKLYALDMIINLPSKIKKEDILSAMKGHILAESQLIGKYKRQR